MKYVLYNSVEYVIDERGVSAFPDICYHKFSTMRLRNFHTSGLIMLGSMFENTRDFNYLRDYFNNFATY